MTDPARILVYRIGAIGDTVIALPAIWDLRRRFPGAELGLLYNTDQVGNTTDARALLQPTGLFRDFIPYRTTCGNGLSRLWRSLGRSLRIMLAVRAGGYQALAYLAPTKRTRWQRRRDRWFFAACGIRIFWGIEAPTITDHDPSATAELLHEATALRRQLGFLSGPPCIDMRITAEERQAARRLLDGIPVGRRLVAIAPGSAMPAKQWPIERFSAVCTALATRHPIQVLVIGGPADRPLGEQLSAALPGACSNLCGRAPPRLTVALLSLADVFIGNDSGNIHLASCSGVPCVGIYSARNYRGRWYPLSSRATTFRLSVPCENCGLSICPIADHPCISGISTPSVTDAALAWLELTNTLSGPL